MARDGTHSRTARKVGAMGPVVTLLVAFVALLAVSRRRRHFAIAADAVVPNAAPSLQPLSSLSVEDGEGWGEARTPRRLPRFVSGTLTGITAGVALGVTAAVLITVASPDVRSAVIVGAGLRSAPASDGEYAARVMAQAMNPTLAYADEAGVAALLTRSPSEPEETDVFTPAEADLRDNAMLVFIVLSALTVLSWALITWGLSGGASRAVEAGVE